MLLNFDIVEYLKVYAPKLATNTLIAPFIFQRSLPSIFLKAHTDIIPMQVTMVIDMNEEVEKSSGPAKLTDEVMGIMCRWF